MSLFPAYATEDSKNNLSDGSLSTEIKYDGSGSITEFTESQLLASDDEQSHESLEKDPQEQPVRERSPLRQSSDFYLDNKLDPGNLWVSTLYYPGRPQYTARSVKTERKKPRRSRRYYECQTEAADDTAEAAERAAAFRRALADQPGDVRLWTQFIEFQERCSGGAAALRAATEACSAAPRSGVLRELRLELARRYLPSDQHLTELRDLLANASSAPEKLSLWVRLLTALAGSPSVSSATLTAAARAALSACRAPLAYPRLLYVYGSFLRSGGLWEQLLLLLELALGMSLPPAARFPPPPDPRQPQLEEALLAKEETLVSSGMPLSAVWVRVERQRARSHWRADSSRAADSADPQCAPAPADLADLLLPLADSDGLFLLLVEALRLVKVPLLPGAQWLQHAVDGPAAAALARAGWTCDCGSALLPLVRAARRLPPAHRARAASLRALPALLQPPHYATQPGFMEWVESLWEAALGWTAPRQRTALLCWRLRWLHSLMLLLDDEDESERAELRRLRALARSSLKRHAEGCLPFLQFARLERLVAGPDAAQHVVLTALRRDQSAPVVVRLYGARVYRELSSATSSAAAWTLACAVLSQPLPDIDRLHCAPPADLSAAVRQCEERCAEIESSFSCRSEEDKDDVCAALLPSEAEWACARAFLASPARRAALLRALRARGDVSDDVTPRERRWLEQEACALTVAAAADAKAVHTARQLAPLFPDNAFLNLAAAGGAVGAVGAWGGAPRSDVATLARALPELLAPLAESTEQEAERVYRGLTRAAAGGGGGALLAGARLEAAARRPRPDPARVLYHALDTFPHSKALHVAGAAWCGSEARALADALLDKQLRLHALPDELTPLVPPPPALTDHVE